MCLFTNGTQSRNPLELSPHTYIINTYQNFKRNKNSCFIHAELPRPTQSCQNLPRKHIIESPVRMKKNLPLKCE